MSRAESNPLTIPDGIKVTLESQQVAVEGKAGKLSFTLHQDVMVTVEGPLINFKGVDSKKETSAQVGTARAIINNMMAGINTGFEKKLKLIGVGYRAKASGKSLNLSLGFSHPVNYAIPEGVTVETPSQTEINIKGIDKQLVGQVAANIRAYRPPEPYKGKGVRYIDEHIMMKEAKKK